MQAHLCMPHTKLNQGLDSRKKRKDYFSLQVISIRICSLIWFLAWLHKL